MIGRNPAAASKVLAVGVLTAGLVAGGFLTPPRAAFAAASVAKGVPYAIAFERNGKSVTRETTARTVGAFLEERGVAISANDYVSPSLDTPLSDGLRVEYHVAVPVTLVVHRVATRVESPAEDVGALLEESGVQLAKDDIVKPSLATTLKPGETVRVIRDQRWQYVQHLPIAARTVREFVFTMKPGRVKIVSHGRPGVREKTVAFERRDGGKVRRTVSSRVVKKPVPQVVVEGIGEYAGFERFAKRGLDKVAAVAAQRLEMVATAYTAQCAGCSGYTAIGRRAGHGIVAVDPRVIPLGTKLYIPGYGFAVAGDTGGAIRGNRIDLGFNSIADALRFGRRSVVVYRLK